MAFFASFYFQYLVTYLFLSSLVLFLCSFILVHTYTIHFSFSNSTTLLLTSLIDECALCKWIHLKLLLLFFHILNLFFIGRNQLIIWIILFDKLCVTTEIFEFWHMEVFEECHNRSQSYFWYCKKYWVSLLEQIWKHFV